mmetsp:Transcript_20741/g.48095  ORF Transcript_20741/g.48095 Transcript_20741/m.48095 type:complete len:282 (+) Transcript_20741:169-1014(+)|eukprot:CAMPEP_0182559064 /NCGR_PEP_ID=MMETSP1324-20130603/2331_1 /TAXON_ID=236786 /ORGANISM="Florenciella sp., Strain RCC1587" /LENGTH=281 /DNA_ID=CAMNT_0024771289 /DNA_START=113 /DNA_END=958 /DNA_ORIENTATION=-
MAGNGEVKKKKKKKNDGPKKIHPHMKNLEIVLDSLELDVMSKEIMGSRWFVNRDRLMEAKVNAWWQTRIIKILAILCALAAPICMFASTDFAQCTDKCETICENNCNKQCPEDLYLRLSYMSTITSRYVDPYDDFVSDLFEEGEVEEGQATNTDLYPNEDGKLGLCKCYCKTCSTMKKCQPGGLTIASQCLIAIAAILVGIDAFYRVDRTIDKRLDAANELTCMGWEFASLSGDFEGYPSHQEAFESFVHETEIILGRLPSSELPYDFIEEPKEEPKTPKK